MISSVVVVATQIPAIRQIRLISQLDQRFPVDHNCELRMVISFIKADSGCCESWSGEC